MCHRCFRLRDLPDFERGRNTRAEHTSSTRSRTWSCCRGLETGPLGEDTVAEHLGDLLPKPRVKRTISALQCTSACQSRLWLHTTNELHFLIVSRKLRAAFHLLRQTLFSEDSHFVHQAPSPLIMYWIFFPCQILRLCMLKIKNMIRLRITNLKPIMDSFWINKI